MSQATVEMPLHTSVKLLAVWILLYHFEDIIKDYDIVVLRHVEDYLYLVSQVTAITLSSPLCNHPLLLNNRTDNRLYESAG